MSDFWVGRPVLWQLRHAGPRARAAATILHLAPWGGKREFEIKLLTELQDNDDPKWLVLYPPGCIVTVGPGDLIVGPEAIAAHVALRMLGQLVLK